METIFDYLDERGFTGLEIETVIDNYIEDFGLNGWDHLMSLEVKEAYSILLEGGYLD
jgi:hypothetical protein